MCDCSDCERDDAPEEEDDYVFCECGERIKDGEFLAEDDGGGYCCEKCYRAAEAEGLLIPND